MRELRDRLQLLKSPDPGSREIALAAGVLDYAQSRLTALQFGQFQARCSGMGLPSRVGEAFSVRGVDGLRAMLDLIWGTIDEVQASNLHEFALNFEMNLTVSNDAVVRGRVKAGGPTTIVTDGTVDSVLMRDPAKTFSVLVGAAEIDGSLVFTRAAGDTPPDLKVIQAAGVDMGDGCFSTNQAIAARNFGVTEKLSCGEAEEGITTQAALYESPGRGLIWKKAGAAGSDRMQAIAAPMIDTGWLDYYPGYRGDPSVPADGVPNAGWPQQKRWTMDIVGAATLVGDTQCPLDVQVFARKPPEVESDGTFGWPAGTRAIDKVQPAATWSGSSLFAIRGCLPAFTWDAVAGAVKLIVFPGIYGGNIDGIEDWYQLRVLIWHRGML